MNYKQKWNKDLENIARNFFTKMEDSFGIPYSEENLDSKITDFFKTHEERKKFFSFLDEHFSLNIRTDYEMRDISHIIYRLYENEIYSYFEKNGINEGYETDHDLFRIYLTKPEEKLNEHILKALKSGEFFCSKDDYVCIRWNLHILCTDVILKKDGEGFKVVAAYPGCVEGNRTEDCTWYPDEKPASEKFSVSVAANPYDFFDTLAVFDDFDEKLDFEPQYTMYGFALAANIDSRTYLKDIKLHEKYKANDGLDKINPVMNIRTKFRELIEFPNLGRKFFMFKWNGYDNNDESCAFDEPVPVFIPARILPRGTELYDEDEIELQILLCGHQAVYLNPYEPNLESFKFDLVVSLYGERKKSRVQIREERIAWQYEFSQNEGEVIEFKKKPAEYVIRIFDEMRPYEDQVIEQCRLFNEKNGIYPNMIVANSATFDRWLDFVEDNVTDSIATDMKFTESDQPGLFDCLDDEKSSECEFVKDDSSNCTVFKTPDFKLYLIENDEIQDGVYEILNSYSPQLEKNVFMYPVVDAEATGKRIRQVMDEKGITPTMVQKVLGGVSLAAIYKWFNGQALPRLDYFAVLSNMLNTPIDDLLIVENQKRDKTG